MYAIQFTFYGFGLAPAGGCLKLLGGMPAAGGKLAPDCPWFVGPGILLKLADQLLKTYEIAY